MASGSYWGALELGGMWRGKGKGRTWTVRGTWLLERAAEMLDSRKSWKSASKATPAGLRFSETVDVLGLALAAGPAEAAPGSVSEVSTAGEGIGGAGIRVAGEANPPSGIEA